jgi:hypothetical protein
LQYLTLLLHYRIVLFTAVQEHAVTVQLTTAKGKKQGTLSFNITCCKPQDVSDAAAAAQLPAIGTMETPGILTAIVLDAALAEAVAGASVTLSLSPGNRAAATRAMLIDDSGKSQSTAHPVWEQILQLPCYSMDFAAIASATAGAENGVTLQVEVNEHSVIIYVSELHTLCCRVAVVVLQYSRRSLRL